jgi:Mn-dependent DtxR family transcriptional regulator
MELFRQWIEDGLTSAEEIAREVGVSKGTVSKMAKKAIEEGWLKKNGRVYALV